jgi:23S rRNA (adenine-N6)-dimethyltransferase
VAGYAPRSRGATGRHALRSAALAADLVLSSGVASDDHVLDAGAGAGLITAELARWAGHVRAVELDPSLAARLRDRFAAVANVTVVEGDLLIDPLPREPFRVVANLPFGSTTAILRRLLDPTSPLEQADVIVEWDFARKRAAVWPSTVLGVCWGVRHELTVVRRLPRTCFAPSPSVDAAVLRITTRQRPLVDACDERRFHAFVRRSFERGVPRTPALKRAARRLGVPPGASPRELDVHQWAALFAATKDVSGGGANKGR